MDTTTLAPFAAIAGAIAGLLVGVGWTWFVGMRTRHTGQASLVAAWIAPTSECVLMNGSDLPVFGVVVWFVEPSAGAAAVRVPVTFPMLPPGRRAVERPPSIAGDGAAGLSVEIAFSDAAGRHWLRRVDGRLEALPVAPLRHYGLTESDGDRASVAADATDRPPGVF